MVDRKEAAFQGGQTKEGQGLSIKTGNTLQTLMVDRKEVKSFLSSWFQGHTNGFLSVSCNGTSGLISKHFPLPVSDTAVHAISRWPDRNVWFTAGIIGKAPQAGRGTADDVSALPGVYADIDCREGIHKTDSKLLPSKDEALAFLQDLPHKWSILNWTGGGFQAFWRFERPWTFSDAEDREKAKRLSDGWQKYLMEEGRKKGWKVDNVGSIEHLMRTPGCFNHKGDPIRVQILELNEIRYPVESFREFLAHKDERCSCKKQGENNGTWDGDIKNLPYSLAERKLIVDGVPDGERSEAIGSIVASSVRRGIPDDVIIQIFESHPDGIGAKYFEKGRGRERWLQGEIERARQFVGQNKHLQPPPVDQPPWIRERFPRGPFPWEVLPHRLAESFKQLARSCASSPTSLPGAAIAIVASVVGCTVSVSLKSSWQEPLVFWFCDIRSSGEGKTPQARALCKVLYDCQDAEDKDYKARFDEWEAQPKKGRGAVFN